MCGIKSATSTARNMLPKCCTATQCREDAAGVVTAAQSKTGTLYGGLIVACQTWQSHDGSRGHSRTIDRRRSRTIALVDGES